MADRSIQELPLPTVLLDVQDIGWLLSVHGGVVCNACIQVVSKGIKPKPSANTGSQ